MDSFDHYTTAQLLAGFKWDLVNTVGGLPITISPNNGRRGTPCLRFTASGQWVLKFASLSTSLFVMGFAIKLSEIGFGEMLFVNDLAGETQLKVRLSTGGYLTVVRSVDSVILGTTTIPLTPGIYHYLEFKFLIDNTVGTIEIRIDSAVALALGGLDTQSSAINSSWEQVYLQNPSNIIMDVDDLYINDGVNVAPVGNIDFWGDVSISPHYPTAEGSLVESIPLSGTDNTLMIDEPILDDDTTYNAFLVVGTDRFILEDLNHSGSVIKAVQMNMATKQSVAGAASIGSVVYFGGASNVDAGQSATGTAVYLCRMRNFNLYPVTNVTWTEALFNAAEFGYKRTV